MVKGEAKNKGVTGKAGVASNLVHQDGNHDHSDKHGFSLLAAAEKGAASNNEPKRREERALAKHELNIRLPTFEGSIESDVEIRLLFLVHSEKQRMTVARTIAKAQLRRRGEELSEPAIAREARAIAAEWICVRRHIDELPHDPGTFDARG